MLPVRAQNAGQAVLLEDIRAQNKVVIEAVQGLGQKLDRIHEELLARIGRVEGVVRGLEGAVRENSTRIARLEDAVREHSREIRDLKEALAGKCDAAALSALEHRVAELERQVGIRPV